VGHLYSFLFHLHVDEQKDYELGVQGFPKNDVKWKLLGCALGT
jgi:hypothetical protein